MQSCEAALEGLVRMPCAKCERVSAFLGEEGLCPSCRAENIERESGLRSGLFRELVALSSRAIDRTEDHKRRRVWRRRVQRSLRGRAVGVA